MYVRLTPLLNLFFSRLPSRYGCVTQRPRFGHHLEIFLSYLFLICGRNPHGTYMK